MRCCQDQEPLRSAEGCADLPERLVRAAVKAALRIAAEEAGAPRLAAPRREMLDELGRQVGQFLSVGLPPAFDEPCDKGRQHVIWYAC
jgi:hypothetical protein